LSVSGRTDTSSRGTLLTLSVVQMRDGCSGDRDGTTSTINLPGTLPVQ
jgi:hypothetical protein